MKDHAAKSLQLCPTLCEPRDGSPPGSPVPGILQARTLEWVCHFLLQCMKVKSESEVSQSCLTPPSMGFSRYWSGVPLPSPMKDHILLQKSEDNVTSGIKSSHAGA